MNTTESTNTNIFKVIRVVSVNLVIILSVRLLSVYSFKGPFNTYLIYFTFIKSVATNKRFGSTTLVRAKGVRISETRHDQSNPNDYYLKS